MIKKEGIRKNFIFQLVYQVVILVLPLITAPYLTRVLGSNGLGNYVYTYSIASYFVLIAMLGIARQGQRAIVANLNDEVKFRKTFWSLFVLHAFSSIIALLIYLIFCVFQKDNSILYYIQLIYVISALFDITWLFYGIQQFKKVVVRSLITKILETICIFLFVKSKNDIYVYTLIMSISALIGQLIMLPQAFLIAKPIKITFDDIKINIKPTLVLSITIIATNLYTIFDKTLIGLMTNTDNVAFYEYADKIIKIPKTIIGVIGTIMFPKACGAFASGEISNSKKYLDYSFIFIFFVSFGAIFGLLGIADNFVYIYYGSSFSITSLIIKVMSPLILLTTICDILRTQILIPAKKDKIYTYCILISVILNIIFSSIFIYIYGILGAVYGTIISELVSCIIHIYLCRKYIVFGRVISNAIPFIIAGLLMYILLIILNVYLENTWYNLIITIGAGLISYVLFVFIYFCLFKRNYIYLILKKNKK